MSEMQLAAIIGGLVLFFLLAALFLVAQLRRRVNRGLALVIHGPGKVDVSFTDRLVLPILQRAETIDLAVHAIEVECRGKEGLVCRDNIRADIKLTYYVRVNKTAEDVLKVADSVGCARASDPQVLRGLFVPRFTEALKTVGKALEFEQLFKQPDQLKDQVIEVIGRDLSGYVLDDVAISYLEQTPLEALDANNILDAAGIRKITESTTRENIRTNELRQQERVEIAKQNLHADEAMGRFDEVRAEMQARAGQAIHAGFIR
jgi:uncharacterized membrane protein YqiK